MSCPTNDVALRAVTEADLATFFEHQQDSAARWMAGFVGKDTTDWPAFAAKWARILADETSTARSIVCDGQLAGSVVSFIAPWSGQREVSYWVGREYWGRGVATRALVDFLGLLAERPLQARAVEDNVASIRVLEKCGFVRIGRARGLAEARGHEVDEVILELRAPATT